MLIKRRNCRGAAKEKFLFAGVIIVLLLGSLLWYNYVHRTPEFSAEKIFQQAFVEAPDSVTDLTGDHSHNFGFDYWIKFKSATSVHLREAQEFQPVVAEVGRRWFASKWKDDRALNDSVNNYEYLHRAHNDIGKGTQEGLLINKNQHSYYYRYWGL